MIYTTATFWKGAFERAIKTAAQTAAAYFVAGSATDLPLAQIGLVTLLALVGSVLTSIATPGTASAVIASPKEA